MQPYTLPKPVIDSLKSALGARNVLTERDELVVYESDGLTLHKYLPAAVIIPGSAEEVAAAVKILAAEQIPFTPRGAGTGLSGGALALKGGVIIELARLNRILKIDYENRLAVVETGVINVNLSQATAAEGFHYAPDPSSQMACTIGGNIAENSGGPHCLKYGMTTNHVLSVEVVLPSGEMVTLGGGGVDLPGYDLLGVFVGCEGTFGIATAATLKLTKLPQAVKTLLAEFMTVTDASRSVSEIIAGGILPAALEMIDQATIQAIESSIFAGGFPTDVVLNLERMNRIIEYSPPDLVIKVEAGLTLSEFSAVTRRERQWLPLDPPGSISASLGAIAACASSGPLRLRFGTPRDYVIGLSLAHADGTESKSGGKVVKNVAGYDMNKLYVGSFGTLAVVTELTFKLRPLPDRSSTIIITSGDRRSLVELARRLSNDFEPASIVVTNGVPLDAIAAGAGDCALAVRFVENDAAVKDQLRSVTEMLGDRSQALVLSENEANGVWARLTNVDRLADNAVRLSVPVGSLADSFEELLATQSESVATADVGTGIIRMAFDADPDSAIKRIKQLRLDASRVGGTLFIERAPAFVRLGADAWGDVGPTAELMKSIKAKFDPQSLLNPGRFVSGI